MVGAFSGFAVAAAFAFTTGFALAFAPDFALDAFALDAFALAFAPVFATGFALAFAPDAFALAFALDAFALAFAPDAFAAGFFAGVAFFVDFAIVGSPDPRVEIGNSTPGKRPVRNPVLARPRRATTLFGAMPHRRKFPRRAVAAAIAYKAGAALLATHSTSPTTSPTPSPTPPTDAVTSCGPIDHDGDRVLVYAVEQPHTGLQYRMQRGQREAFDVGWGYDGRPACRLAANRDRIAVVFPFMDPYGGGKAELRITIVVGIEVVERTKVLSTWCWDIEPIAIAADRDGWVIDYRCDDDAPVEHIVVDRDGYPRRNIDDEPRR